MTDHPDRPLRIILDTSAVLAFSRATFAVGETLAEIEHEKGAVGLPVLCLAAAHPHATDTDLFAVLLELPATRVLDLPGDWWHDLAAASNFVGRPDAASAVVAAIQYDCSVLTGQPHLYAGLAGGGPIIPIDPDPA